MSDTHAVAVAGASGYSGGELLRILAGHPGFDVVMAAAGGKAGKPIVEAHPHLVDYAGRVFDATDPDRMADADVVFLALPHGESAAIARKIPSSTLVIDLGADHRLRDADAWESFYGSGHAGTWLYGLPELAGTRDALPGASRIANPGCYPTAVGLALAPLLAAGLMEPDDLIVVAASGTSGAGRTPSDALLASQVMGSMTAYKVGGVHQHTPEMEQVLSQAAGQPVKVSFTPTLAPMPRGILATCSGRVAGSATEEDIRDAFHDAYAAEPFVHLMPHGRWPATASTVGSNCAHIQAAMDPRTGRVTVVSAIDNLVKGAAGQAVQNVNLALELPETMGLATNGVAP
ncbi:MAG: N-acetyl-gamma-glutamyl-phosphate reductase [Candidatus Nanopelagicales bacterium]|nr:N-acetyl-gamma-glutamyl-phosphate reductase [Candidatus Nanopelagicales bacterium]